MAEQEQERFNFHLLYQGCYNAVQEVQDSIDETARNFCEQTVIRKTEQFNAALAENERIRWLNPTDLLPGASWGNHFADHYRSDVLLVVTSNESRIENDGVFRNILDEAMFEHVVYRKELIHVHIGEFNEENFPLLFRSFVRVQLPSDFDVDADQYRTEELKALMGAIFWVLWEKPLAQIAKFVELECSNDIIVGLYRHHGLRNLYHMSPLMSQMIEELMEEKAFFAWCSNHKLSRRVINYLRSRNITTEVTLLAVEENEIPGFESLHPNERLSLRTALNRLRDREFFGYWWRYPLDCHRYKISHFSTGIVLARFTNPNHDLDVHVAGQNIGQFDNMFTGIIRKGTTRVIRILDGSLVFCSILEASGDRELNTMMSDIELFMTSKDQSISVSLEDGSTVKLHPCEEKDNFLFARLSLDAELMRNLELYRGLKGDEILLVEDEGLVQEAFDPRIEMENIEKQEKDLAEMHARNERKGQEMKALSEKLLQEQREYERDKEMIREKFEQLRLRKEKFEQRFPHQEAPVGDESFCSVTEDPSNPNVLEMISFIKDGKLQDVQEVTKFSRNASENSQNLAVKTLKEVTSASKFEKQLDKVDSLTEKLPERLLRVASPVFHQGRKKHYIRLNVIWLVREWKQLHSTSNVPLISPMFGRDGIVWCVELYPNWKDSRYHDAVRVSVRLLRLPNEMKSTGIVAQFWVKCDFQLFQAQDAQFQEGESFSAIYGRRGDFNTQSLRFQIQLEYAC